MADDVKPPVNNAQTPPDDKKVTPPQSDQASMTKMAEELGMVRKENETLKEYQTRVNPVIETIWSDPELLKRVDQVHKKRLGIKVDDDKKPDDQASPDGEPKIPAKPTSTDVDTRNAMIRTIVDGFSDKFGITKLEAEAKKEMNLKVGTMLQELLDPKGNKNLQQIMEDVSLTKLPSYLEHAYYLANKDTVVKEAKEQGKKEAQDQSRGIIGSFSSTSIETDSMTLTPQERKSADSIGVSHEKYLARKKEIAKRNNKLI